MYFLTKQKVSKLTSFSSISVSTDSEWYLFHSQRGTFENELSLGLQ